VRSPRRSSTSRVRGQRRLTTKRSLDGRSWLDGQDLTASEHFFQARQEHQKGASTGCTLGSADPWYRAAGNRRCHWRRAARRHRRWRANATNNRPAPAPRGRKDPTGVTAVRSAPDHPTAPPWSNEDDTNEHFCEPSGHPLGRRTRRRGCRTSTHRTRGDGRRHRRGGWPTDFCGSSDWALSFGMAPGEGWVWTLRAES